MGVFYGVRNVASQELFRTIALWLVLTQNSSHTYFAKDETARYFIQFATEANVCKIVFYFKHSVDA